MAEALVFKLTAVGFYALSVPNGAEAIELLQAEKFDLLLLDLVMPKMDGFTTLEKIRGLKVV